MSNSADWQEPKERFQVLRHFCEPHTINFYKDCHNLTQHERKELAVNKRMSKMLVAEKRTRGKWAEGWGTCGLEQKIMEIYAAKKINAKNLLKSGQKEWLETSQYREELSLV